MANIKLLDLLYESLNGARTNYLNKGKIDRTTFEEFNTIDTSKTKKYIEKMCQFYYEYKISKEEIIEAFTEAIPKIERKLVHFDINKLKTLKDFESFKDKIAFADIKNTKEKRKIVVEKGTKQVYRDDRFTILRVDSRDAMKRIGLNTTWCLTYKDDDRNMFYRFPYLYQTSYVIFDNKYPDKHSLSKINAQVNKNDSLGEIRTADQVWEGKEDTNVPVEYLEELGLNINLFKWTEDKIDYYKENYLFTFKDGLTYKIVKDKFSWLLKKDVNIKNAVIGYSGNKLIWYDGFWSKGTWEDGIWKKGLFSENAIWKGGTFESNNYSYFEGKWYGGEWKGKYFWGEWLDKKNPKPINVKEYKDGLTYEIVKDKFPWLLEEDVQLHEAVIGQKGNKLIWYAGAWRKGTWEDGIWKNGTFDEKGIWKDGIFEGTLFNGKWYGGEWKGGDFRGQWLDPNNPKPE